MRHWMCVGLFFVCLMLSSRTSAASLSVQVTDRAGKPVADAVVTVLGAGPRAAPATRIVDQKQLTFLPYVEVFHPGDSLVFRNSDRTRHHVYSFSPAKQFEFVVDADGRSAPLLLDKTGRGRGGLQHPRRHDQLPLRHRCAVRRAHGRQTGACRSTACRPAPSKCVSGNPGSRRDAPDLRQQSIVLAAPEKKTVVFQLTLRPDSRRQFDREHTHY